MRKELQSALSNLATSHRIALQSAAANARITVEHLVEAIFKRTRFVPSAAIDAAARLDDETRKIVVALEKDIGAMAAPPRIIALTGGAQMNDRDAFIEAITELVPDEQLPCRIELVEGVVWLCIRHVGTDRSMRNVQLAPETHELILSMVRLPRPAEPRKPVEHEAPKGTP
jgi:hypothetical protein